MITEPKTNERKVEKQIKEKGYRLRLTNGFDKTYLITIDRPCLKNCFECNDLIDGLNNVLDFINKR